MARVVNDYIYPIRNAYAYITINYEYEDVVDPPEGIRVYIRTERFTHLEEDRLAWALASPIDNPVSLDILSGEHQALLILNLDLERRWIEIPSERGLGSREKEKISRVFLRPKKYSGYIKIVSFDTRAKIFPIEIDPTDQDYPVRAV